NHNLVKVSAARWSRYGATYRARADLFERTTAVPIDPTEADTQQPRSGLGRRGFLAMASGTALAAAPAVAFASSASAATPSDTPVAPAVAPPPATAAPGDPDFGPNVYVFDSSMPAASIQATIDAVYAPQPNP